MKEQNTRFCTKSRINKRAERAGGVLQVDLSLETASQKAVEKYDEYMKSKDFQNGEFPRVPVPEYKEGAYH